MRTNRPTQFAYGNYVGIDGEQLRGVLQETSIRWRKHEDGSRRTYIPSARFYERPLFGGSRDFRQAMNSCITAANLLMAELLEDTRWSGNRVVINAMSKQHGLPLHTDPLHFMDGAVVIGLGRANFYYIEDGQERRIDTLNHSLMFIPQGIPHKVESSTGDRFSVVIAYDTQLAAGQTATGQFMQRFKISR